MYHLINFFLSKGLNLAEAIYNSKWYDVNKSAAKYVMIVTLRAQNPMHFTASGFAIISQLTIVFVSKLFILIVS